MAPANGEVSVTGLTVGSLASYRCNNGYILVGDNNRRCREPQGWTGSAPTCQRTCPATSNLRSFFVERMKCTHINLLYSNDNLTQKHVCLCAGVDCGLLEPPLNGQVMAMGTTLSSRAMYTCNRGYILLGSATRSCQANGLWSGSEPTCSGMGMKPKKPNNPNTMINP